jgi:hypothetical protein
MFRVHDHFPANKRQQTCGEKRQMRKREERPKKEKNEWAHLYCTMVVGGFADKVGLMRWW